MALRPLPHRKGTALMTAARRKSLIKKGNAGGLAGSLLREARVALGQENSLKLEASNVKRNKGVAASISRAKKKKKK